MKIFAISDLHLSFQVEKPMDIFGENWEGYEEKIKENWNKKVSNEDIVIIAGDISWGMQMQETQKDFEFISNLNGTKIIIRGNHDYWWSAISKVRDFVPENIYAIQNDSLKINKYIFCGSRGWTVPEPDKKQSEEDKRIYDRELIRLEMSIQSALKQVEDGDEIILIMHYPPFNSALEESDFTKLIEKYNIKTVVYGHLHGKLKYKQTTLEKNGVNYILSSCDKIHFDPVLIK